MSRSKRVNWIEGIHYERLEPPVGADKYEMLTTMAHRGPNGLVKTIPIRRRSDGATHARDLCAEAFFTHDEFCLDPFWDDGTPISNWEASREYRKILKRNGHPMDGMVRHYFTFVFGGKRIKKMNGWFKKA